MNNSFTYESYEFFLETLARDYEFIPFSRAKYSNEKLERKVLLRHDIDQSLEKAENMAKIEAKLGITSTYFLFLKSPFYNIFSHEDEKRIRKIIEYNHCIGLHFDYSKSSRRTIAQIPYQIRQEAEFLQNYFEIKVDAISFHRPFNIKFFNKMELSSYPNAYEKVFVENFKYFSDSRGCWRYGHPFESIEYAEKRNLHILVHPIWWNESELSPIETLDKFKQMYNNRFSSDLYNELKSFWESLENKIHSLETKDPDKTIFQEESEKNNHESRTKQEIEIGTGT
jgi:hypothetical protein